MQRAISTACSPRHQSSLHTWAVASLSGAFGYHVAAMVGCAETVRAACTKCILPWRRTADGRPSEESCRGIPLNSRRVHLCSQIHLNTSPYRGFYTLTCTLTGSAAFASPFSRPLPNLRVPAFGRLVAEGVIQAGLLLSPVAGPGTTLYDAPSLL